MGNGFLDTLKTPSIEAARKANGGDAGWANFAGHRDFDRFTDDERAFISQRDSFYMATVAENGWPYMQHRGRRPRLPAGSRRQDAGLRRLPRQPAIHQRGKSERRRPCRAVLDGLREEGEAEDPGPCRGQGPQGRSRRGKVGGAWIKGEG
jgi:hypothetical protein